MSKKTVIGKFIDGQSADRDPSIPAAEITNTDPSASTIPTYSIEDRLQAWVKSVEKDTEEKVQEYLEQSEAGQNGE